VPDRYIHHVTITTGHVRRSYRDEVSDEALVACREILARAESDVPGQPGYRVRVTRSRGCMVATVHHDAVPVVTIGIATHSRCGSRLWRLMHSSGIAMAACPPEPWVAALILPGLVDAMDAASWLGDFERCLGWAALTEDHHE
jgi:hypothetical protein